LEYVMGGQENPLTGQMVNNSDLSNVFNGTTNSIKNIFVGILITIWATISVRAGREISAKLGQGSKSDGPTEEQKKISKVRMRKRKREPTGARHVQFDPKTN